jgi:hypothetical protein
MPRNLTRRRFLASAPVGALLTTNLLENQSLRAAQEQPLSIAALPEGAAPPALSFDHFPSRVHAFVWRNWELIPVERIARVVGAGAADILRMGKAMGLQAPPRITREQQRRSRITVIRANWHLLPYDQLLQLLEMTPAELAFMLREDDFLFVKLGNLKPECAPLKFVQPDDATRQAETKIAHVIENAFPKSSSEKHEPLFTFVQDLSRPPENQAAPRCTISPRYCYSYFALYGDPLLEPELDPYPDGYVARLRQAGVDGVWLQGVLKKLAPYPYWPSESDRYKERLNNLTKLVQRLKKQGMSLYLYLNEPRALPLEILKSRPELKGVTEGEYAALCTSNPEVRRYLTESIATICRAVPDLGGFFTITGSENLTNCWSHFRGKECPRCGKREPSDVIAEVNTAFHEGIQEANSNARLIAWDWGWRDEWVPSIIEKLPKDVSWMCVSEWGMPIERGGVKSNVGEYSISTIGPGERAKEFWSIAKGQGHHALAKIQAGNTWELSAVPYIPAVANVAQHAANLREAGVDGIMLGWTIGGYPSPNLEVVAEIFGAENPPAGPQDAMLRVAQRRFGPRMAPVLVQAWTAFSAAFSEFPFDGGVVYNAPLQMGPANLLWSKPTAYRATMVGLPYDDLNSWRSVYPEQAFIQQLEKVANGWSKALADFERAIEPMLSLAQHQEEKNVQSELRIAEAAGIHFASVANQARFVQERRKVLKQKSPKTSVDALEQLIRFEMEFARRLHLLQRADSRIGFEATNQYYYTPNDLLEKILNCQYLLEHWIPGFRE